MEAAASLALLELEIDGVLVRLGAGGAEENLKFLGGSGGQLNLEWVEKGKEACPRESVLDLRCGWGAKEGMWG